ncbi:MAG: 23S rRNA pseudouridine(1911/1915/1917) synthase RluD [Gammaproteobacteria bacterium]|nr:23S rRNA pseudouridine(1911/1915/1917) synthase RluD [Gammaproteobacteria bacterium]MBQ0839428.1 23S rRNA pseudouridine(1911/1915/1917) synthase RluD [Gammaproteobacteria bacterium]
MPSDHSEISLQAEVPSSLSGARLDQAAAELFKTYSRTRLQQWIRDGFLLVDGRAGKTREKLLGGECLTLKAKLEAEGDWQPQPVPFDIVFEDDSVIVVNKAAGLVVHPGAGNPDGTLLNGLLHHCEQLATVPRAGIVHRLDKDTSGLMVVAKTLEAHHSLSTQLKERSVKRHYRAIVQGVMTGGGKVDVPIGRHPTSRTRMAVLRPGREAGSRYREAISHYRLVERFAKHTHLEVALETGRTHQIRVHMAHLGYPLVGDVVYGGRLRLSAGSSAELSLALSEFPRQALHALRLSFIHPHSGEIVEWESDLPDDMQHLLAILQRDPLLG